MKCRGAPSPRSGRSPPLEAPSPNGPSAQRRTFFQPPPRGAGSRSPSSSAPTHAQAPGSAPGHRGAHSPAPHPHRLAPRGRRSRLVPSLPIANHGGRDIQLPTQLGERLLAVQDSSNRFPLELCGKDSTPVRLPWKITHGPSIRVILRSMGVQSNGERSISPCCCKPTRRYRRSEDFSIRRSKDF